MTATERLAQMFEAVRADIDTVPNEHDTEFQQWVGDRLQEVPR
jgi:hypothetical protein